MSRPTPTSRATTTWSAPAQALATGDLMTQFGAATIAGAMPHRATVRVTRGHSTDGRLTIAAGWPIESSGSFDPSDRRYRGEPLDLPRAAIRLAADNDDELLANLLVTVESQIPTGLGSNAAATLATVAAVRDALHLRLDLDEICRKAYRAESSNDLNPSWRSYIISGNGGLRHIGVAEPELTDGTRDANAFPLIGAGFQPIILLADTGIRPNQEELRNSRLHQMGQARSGLLDAYAGRMDLVTRQMVAELAAAQIDYARIGELLHYANKLVHHYLDCSNTEINIYLEDCMRLGAVGGRIAGSIPGVGCFYVVIKPDDGAIAEAITHMLSERGMAVTRINGFEPHGLIRH